MKIVDKGKPKAVVVVGKEATWLEQHAAEELVRYIHAMSGASLRIVTSDEWQAEGERRKANGERWKAGSGEGTAILIGRAETHPLIADLVRQGTVKLSADYPGLDGFIITTISPAPLLPCSHVVVMGGSNDVGTLYAVYAYLERYCDVGFFLDGERIPTRQSLSLEGISLSEKPRFTVRQIIGPIGPDDADYYPAFDRYRGIFWDFEQWRNWLDWMVKNRFNYTVLNLMPRATGVYDKVYPGQLDYNWWPHEYRNQLFHQIVDYGRKLGIGFWTTFYEDQNNPRLWRTMREEFGGGYWYGVTLGETKFAEELVQHLLGRIEKVKEVDPEARITVDTWTIPYLGWTKEEASWLFSLLPKDVCLVETQADWDSIYKTYNYYDGREFAFGIIHSFTHWDVLHSRIRQYAADLREVANDPKAANCIGVSLVPELVVPTWDFLYGYALGRLAWNPNEVTYEGLMHDFVCARFGRESVPNMLKSVELLETFNNDIRFKGGIMEGHYLMPFHRTCMVWQPRHPYTDEQFIHEARAKLGEDLTPLREAVRYALAERDRLKGDRLYENFLTELARTYISEMTTHHLIMVYQHYKAATRLFGRGDPEGAQQYVKDFETESGIVNRALTLLEDLLSTREEYSLGRFLDRVMAVPGTQPGTARDIKARYWYIGGYYRNEIYEVLRDVYRPEVDAFVGELRRRLQSGERELIDLSKGYGGPFGETFSAEPHLLAAAQRIKAQFLDHPLAAPKQPGAGTIEMVQEAFDALPVPLGLMVIDNP